MYFSNIKNLSNGFVVYSNTVESPGWNFFTGFHAKNIEEFKNCINEATAFFNSINRPLVLVVGPNVKISKPVKKYIQDNFSNFENNVILFSKTLKVDKKSPSNYTFRKIDNQKERKLFVDVFRTSKLQTKPDDVYPPLPEYFFKALDESFDHKGEWVFEHFVSEYDNSPVGMVSACIKDTFCGLYGGGTYLAHRGKGVFSNLLKFVELYAKTKGCKYFFGITEKDSYNEKFYNSMKWKSIIQLSFYKPQNL